MYVSILLTTLCTMHVSVHVEVRKTNGYPRTGVTELRVITRVLEIKPGSSTRKCPYLLSHLLRYLSLITSTIYFF